MNIHYLDNPQVYNKYDPGNMLVSLQGMPEMCSQAWQTAMDFSLPNDYKKADKVVIVGMGASAIGGDLASNLVATETRIPVTLHSNYHLPAFVNSNTLIIFSSYSGNTEEVLSSFKQALKIRTKNLAITTGGKLNAMANAKNVPVLIIDYQAPPRATLPFSFLPILCFLQRLGFISDKSTDVTEMIAVLEELCQRIGSDTPLSQNPAKQLAEKLYSSLPVVYGADILSQVAHRWKTQLNENSKAWAFYEVLPELNHNAIVGYRFPAEVTSRILVILLWSTHLSQRIQLRYRITCRILEQADVSYHIVDGEGTSPLSQMMSLLLLGDFASYYLAMLYKVDPSPNQAIDYLKEQLKDNSY